MLTFIAWKLIVQAYPGVLKNKWGTWACLGIVCENNFYKKKKKKGEWEQLIFFFFDTFWDTNMLGNSEYMCFNQFSIFQKIFF